MMRIGILETGRPAPSLGAEYGSYPDMVATLLAAGDGQLEFARFAVLEDELPASVEDCDGYVVTGSRFAVMEESPWMLRLESFLRQAMAAERPIFGICFGHQILAKAMGGVVKKAGQGWQLGLKRYHLAKHPAWMDPAPDSIVLNAFHQDQVQEIPEGAEIIATALACPVAGLAYGDKAFSLQAHPEFSVEFERALLKANSGKTVPPDLGQEALSGLTPGTETDAPLVARWVRRFFLGQAPA